jgi:8-oxo-dGTP pyrophosphatase MutT (NUDIX family)
LSQHGLSQHGLSQHGLSQHGLSQHGLSQHGLGRTVGTMSVDEQPLREQVLDSVRRRVPINRDEQRSIDRFLLEFDRLRDPFDELSDPVHVTGSAIVVGPRGVLLLKHKRLGLWLQPGGHVDPGEAPWEAALREANEETGLAVSFHPASRPGVPELIHVDVHAGGRGHTHLDLRYLVDGGTADPSPGDGESQQIEWLNWDDAIERASDERLTALLASLKSDRWR